MVDNNPTLENAVTLNNEITDTVATLLATKRIESGDVDSTRLTDPVLINKLITAENEQLELSDADFRTKLKHTVSHSRMLHDAFFPKEQLPTLKKATQLNESIKDTVAGLIAEQRVMTGDVRPGILGSDPGLASLVFAKEELLLKNAPAHQKIQHTVAQIKIERNIP